MQASAGTKRWCQVGGFVCAKHQVPDIGTCCPYYPLPTSPAHRELLVHLASDNSVLVGAASCCVCYLPVAGGRLVGDAVRVLPGTFLGCPAHLVSPSREGQQGPAAVLHFFRCAHHAPTLSAVGQHCMTVNVC